MSVQVGSGERERLHVQGGSGDFAPTCGCGVDLLRGCGIGLV